MPLLPMAPPQPVAIYSGFDYVTVDDARARVYAAHTGSGSILVVNASTGREIGQVGTGTPHGVAVDPQSGHVYTGDGVDRTMSEVDPVSLKVVNSVDVDGPVDAVAYDPVLHRIYGDEDDGTRIFVIDAKSFKQVGTVHLPGHKPEYLAIDPASHRIYQNIANLSEYVVIDPTTLKVTQTVKTPELVNNHPLQYDPALKHLYVGGKNGVMSTYDLSGKKLTQASFAGGVDQCSLDTERHTLYCAGDATLTAFHDGGAGMTVVATRGVDKDVHTVGVGQKTGAIWIVWAAKTGDFVQGLRMKR